MAQAHWDQAHDNQRRGEVIYNCKKNEEIQERKKNFLRIYELVEVGDRDRDADSPRYFLDSDDDEWWNFGTY